MPAPVRPTMPTFSSPSILTFNFLSTSSPCRYRKLASLKTISPLSGQFLGGLFSLITSGASCSKVSYSLIRSTELILASISTALKASQLRIGVKPEVLANAKASTKVNKAPKQIFYVPARPPWIALAPETRRLTIRIIKINTIDVPIASRIRLNQLVQKQR